MANNYVRRGPVRSLLLLVLTSVSLTGCGLTQPEKVYPIYPEPRELNKYTLADYVIEPPDILTINLQAAVPKPPYIVKPLDTLGVVVPGALPDEPIAGAYPVAPDGMIDFRGTYGKVMVSGLTLDEVRAAIEKQLSGQLKKPTTEVQLLESRGMQLVQGQHLVQPDGKVNLGIYGSIPVAGFTLDLAKAAIESRLSQYFVDPEVSLQIAGFNSKVYYVIFDGGVGGQQIARLPITGGETVLDAIAQLSGLTPVSDPELIWVARPSTAGCPYGILPVDWLAVTHCGDPRTNYQLRPGDRVFVQSYKAFRIDGYLARIFAPIERVLGITILGAGTARQFQRIGNRNGNVIVN